MDLLIGLLSWREHSINVVWQLHVDSLTVRSVPTELKVTGCLLGIRGLDGTITAIRRLRHCTLLYEQIGRLNMELDWLKKRLPQVAEHRRMLVEPGHPKLRPRRQCVSLEVSRSTLFYQPGTESEANHHLMRLIDEQYTKTPFYGVPRTAWRRSQGRIVNPKRVENLYRKRYSLP